VTGAFPVALSVDVEEWFHNCWVQEYVDPRHRPPLARELDRLLPLLLETLDLAGARATWFVLGEVAAEVPHRIREAAAAGHEIACHGDLHLRANDRSPAAFRADLLQARARLEDLVGREVSGFRSPEWSLRRPTNPRFRIVAECGFEYDSSLAPAVGAGSTDNPTGVRRYRWPDGVEILELPPLVWGGPLRLPAGGWCGRVAPISWLRAAVDRARLAGELPLLVVHPWELVDRPVPGLFTGFARFFHDAGRTGYRERFLALASGLEARPLGAALGAVTALVPEESTATLGPFAAAAGAP
jgi:peptidoglycan/xylan/chitin deacetylase (PgdA/CDA1 family)